MTGLEVVEAVRDLVAAGEYRDDIPGLPGAALDGPGVFLGDPESRRARRMYTRGSPEYLEAQARGLLDRLPPLTPAPPEAVAEAEAVVGHSLPSLLHRLYLEIGNGGFGPGYGLLGVRGGHRDDRGRTAIDQLQMWRSWRPAFPPVLLPICHWGCAIYSLVDCSTNEGMMWGWDPNPAPPGLDLPLFPESTTLRTWFERWLEGRLWQPTLVQDETTGEWRGATDEEQRRWDEEMGEV